MALKYLIGVLAVIGYWLWTTFRKLYSKANRKNDKVPDVATIKKITPLADNSGKAGWKVGDTLKESLPDCTDIGVEPQIPSLRKVLLKSRIQLSLVTSDRNLLGDWGTQRSHGYIEHDKRYQSFSLRCFFFKDCHINISRQIKFSRKT